MKNTILHEFVAKENVKETILGMYNTYYTKQCIRGGSHKKQSINTKIKESQCDIFSINFSDDEIAEMYAILLGNYLKDSCYTNNQWDHFFERKERKQQNGKKILKTFEFSLKISLSQISQIEYINDPQIFYHGRAAKQFCEFFTSDNPKESYWGIIAVLSVCWILDNKLIDYLNEIQVFNRISQQYNTEMMDDNQKCKIYAANILQNFHECNIERKKQKATPTKQSNKSDTNVTGDIFPSLDHAEDVLFGKDIFETCRKTIAENKLRISSNDYQTIETDENVESTKKVSNPYKIIHYIPQSIERKYFNLITAGYNCFTFSDKSTADKNTVDCENPYDIEATFEIETNTKLKKKTDIKNDLLKQIVKRLDEFFKTQEDSLRKSAQNVIKEVNHQPLMGYLYQKLVERKQISYLYEYRELVKTIVSCNKNGHLTVAPPVSTLIEQIHTGIKKYTSDKFFNERDVYEILGEFALAATQNSTYHIPLDKFQETNDSFKNKILQQIKQDINNQKFRWITCIDDQHYRFTLKHYRLIFTALKKSEQYNAEFISRSKSIPEICQSILNEMRLSPLQNNDSIDIEDTNKSSHTDWSFDSLVVYGTALLLSSHTSIMYHMIDELRKIAQNFSIRNQNRKRQESAINLICNLLCEKHNLLPEYQENMFRDTYGKSIYHFQIAAWHHLSGISEPNMTFSCYTDIVYKSIEKACRLRNDHKYANAAPYFILLKGYIDDKSRSEEHKQFDIAEDSTIYLYDCCKIQSEIWNINQELTHDKEMNELRKIMEILKKAHDIFKGWIEIEFPHNNGLDTTDKYPLAWVYGCNMALYALADIEREEHEKSFFERIHLYKASIPFSERDFIETIVLCDYFNRKLSFNYDIEYDSNNCTANNIFLLCGSFRITSIDSIITEISISQNRFTLTKSQKEDYKRWLDNESTGTRYKVLLTRYLLICTDYYDKDTPITLSVSDFDDGFLEYDSISQSDVSELKTIISSNDPNKDIKIKTILKKNHLLQK